MRESRVEVSSLDSGGIRYFLAGGISGDHHYFNSFAALLKQRVRESRAADFLNPKRARAASHNAEPRALMENFCRISASAFGNSSKQPGFAALAIISMALGIGANTSIFSLVDTALLRPLAVKEPSQLVELYGTLHNGADWSLQSYPNYKDYRDRNTVFSGLFVYRVVVSSLTVNNSSQRVWGYLVSGNYFDVLGVKPMLGRAFLPEEDQTPDSHPVAVISYNCWQHRFGGDRAIVGKTVEFNSRPFTIIGVAPKGFIGTEVAYDPEMFIPVMMAKTIEPGSTWIDKRDSNNLFTVGRLKPGVSFAQAKAAARDADGETRAGLSAERRPRHPARQTRLVHSRYREFCLRLHWSARSRGCARDFARVRESCQSAARARDGTAAGNCRAARDWRKPATTRQATAH